MIRCKEGQKEAMTPKRSLQPLVAVLASLWVGLPSGCGSSAPPAPKANPDYIQGAIAYREGDRDKAMESLKKAVAVKGDLIMAQVLLGHIYREKEDYENAAQHYQIVCRLDPYVAANHYNLALMHHYLWRLQEACESYQRAVQLDRRDFRANMNLGLVLDAMGKAAEGVKFSQAAAELEPKSAEAWSNYGVVLDSLKRYPEAEAAYRKAIELDSGRVETQVNLAGNLLAQAKYREAASAYEQIARRLDNTFIRYRWGRALLGLGRYDEAAAQFSEAVKREPGNWRALNGLGDVMLAQYKQSALLDEAKRVAAVQYWKKSLAINANQPPIAALVKEYQEVKLFGP